MTNNEREPILLLADCHANETALLEVVRDARKRYAAIGKLKIWSLGDLFGRGPMPGTTWRRLLDYHPEASVAGNHDLGLIGCTQNAESNGYSDGPFGKHDWQVIMRQRAHLVQLGLLTLDTQNVPCGGKIFDYLSRLPIVCSPRPGIYMLHGGLEQPISAQTPLADLAWHLIWDYVKNADGARYTIDLVERLYAQRADLPTWFAGDEWCGPPALVLVGHFHRRLLYSNVAGQGEWVHPVLVDHPYELRLDPGQPELLSPGGVGFPREEGDRDASYAVLCPYGPTSWTVTFHKTTFDRRAVRCKMRESSYPEESIRHLRLPGETDDPL